eukprot:s3647_g4.t1
MILQAFTYLPAAGASFVHLAAQVPWQSLPGLDAGLEHAARAEYELGVQAWNLRQPEQGLELSAQKGHQVGEYCFRYGMPACLSCCSFLRVRFFVLRDVCGLLSLSQLGSQSVKEDIFYLVVSHGRHSEPCIVYKKIIGESTVSGQQHSLGQLRCD